MATVIIFYCPRNHKPAKWVAPSQRGKLLLFVKLIPEDLKAFLIRVKLRSSEK